MKTTTFLYYLKNSHLPVKTEQSKGLSPLMFAFQDKELRFVSVSQTPSETVRQRQSPVQLGRPSNQPEANIRKATKFLQHVSKVSKSKSSKMWHRC